MLKRKSTTSLKAPKSRKSSQVEHSVGSSQIPVSSQSAPDNSATRSRLTNDFNVEELTATITKSVTDAVLLNLRQSGILSPPSTSELDSNQTNIEGPTSSNTTGQANMTLSTASSSGGVTDGYISPRTPLHALVSHKKRKKSGLGNILICPHCRRRMQRIFVLTCGLEPCLLQTHKRSVSLI